MSEIVQLLVILVPILLVSMSVHEVMHAYASLKLGDDTAHSMGRISWNPMVHIDPVMTLGLPIVLVLLQTGFIFAAAKPVQVNFARLKWGEFGGAIVGAVGPLSNVVMALLGAALFNILTPDFGGTLYNILYLFVYINVILAIFNSIPWPPLDGSRILYAFAPRPLQEFMESIERMGLMSLALFILFFFYFLAEPVFRLVSSITGTLLGGPGIF